jgi:hypothetical protein
MGRTKKRFREHEKPRKFAENRIELSYCVETKMADNAQNYGAFADAIRATINQCLAKRIARDIETADRVSLESGLTFARAITGAAPVWHQAPPAPARVVDGAGHCRPIYRSLVVYAWMRTIELETAPRTSTDRDWTKQLLPWCELIEKELSAKRGHRPAEAGWNALALSVAATPLGRADWLPLSANIFRGLAQAQQPDGALLQPSSAINPETRWYDELVLLHALGSYAAQSRDAAIERAVERATEFHLRETQPDHATQQPWAIYAFLSNPQTRIQAEQILHTAALQDSRNLDAISLILLADTLWCLRSSTPSAHGVR